MTNYILEYREYGKTNTLTIKAINILDAEQQAKTFCAENFIMIAYLLTKSGKCLVI